MSLVFIRETSVNTGDECVSHNQQIKMRITTLYIFKWMHLLIHKQAHWSKCHCVLTGIFTLQIHNWYHSCPQNYLKIIGASCCIYVRMYYSYFSLTSSHTYLWYCCKSIFPQNTTTTKVKNCLQVILNCKQGPWFCTCKTFSRW